MEIRMNGSTETRARWTPAGCGLATLLLTATLTACVKDGDAKPSAQEPVNSDLPAVLATVGDQQITLADVLRAIHGQVFDSPALSDNDCPPELRNAWRRLQSTLDDTAGSITFQQLLDASVDKEKMYYI